MIKPTFRVVTVSFFLFLSLSAMADSPKDMLRAGRVDDAISALNGQISSNPRDAESIHLLCRAYFQYEDWDRAESRCKRATELDPNNSPFHRWLGRVYGQKAERANILSAASLAGKTRDEFQRAAQLDPRDTDALLDVAEYYIEAPGFMGGGEDRARDQAKVIGKLSPAKEHWVYARLAEKRKDFATSEREYRQMIEAAKSDAEAWLNLGFFYRNRKRYDDMEQAFVKMNQGPMPHREVLFEAANSLFHTGRAFSFAIELLRRYLAEGPVEEAPAFRGHCLLGQLLEEQGNKTGAAAEYRAGLALARNYEPCRRGLNRVAP
ncbi:MAG: tetratricopeptide repeat protein [Acidobacteriales bacterium]|nr:tetratricopeptide repeat protein [Terriglobales bacterium]